MLLFITAVKEFHLFLYLSVQEVEISIRYLLFQPRGCFVSIYESLTDEGMPQVIPSAE